MGLIWASFALRFCSFNGACCLRGLAVLHIPSFVSYRVAMKSLRWCRFEGPPSFSGTPPRFTGIETVSELNVKFDKRAGGV